MKPKVYPGWERGSTMEGIGGVKPGAKAKPFRLPGVDGKTYSLEDFGKSRILVVTWMCVHCPYVQASEDRILSLAKEMRSRGVQFVAINSNDAKNYPEDSFENMQKRAKEKSYPFPYLHDENQSVAKAYGPVATPEFFVFDSDLVLRYRGQLDDSHRNPRAVKRQTLREVLTNLSEGKEPKLNFAPTMGCSIKWAS